ncbi:Hypothetical Protein FCC1311_098122 [Hondaea fermentalgiana]|uniref:Uncharacterized protein n=1 Tax=Hondaea fermentalgiana TaxID=2315210 RepID=A0A2R5GTD5_9STRA|nr:Hypothetical Protein FCC1311_098122 [Hondaea fermentalgiana]|eukprot:GBG33589.1 Hypothetical Protein FCC1311_098122 [Hondaea fermentalgiana]
MVRLKYVAAGLIAGLAWWQAQASQTDSHVPTKLNMTAMMEDSEDDFAEIEEDLNDDEYNFEGRDLAAKPTRAEIIEWRKKLFEKYSSNCNLMKTKAARKKCKREARMLARQEARAAASGALELAASSVPTDAYGFYMAPTDSLGDLIFNNPKAYCRKIYEEASEGASLSLLTKCSNELSLAGHLEPVASDDESFSVMNDVCYDLNEVVCRMTPGCAYNNGECFGIVTNEHCDGYTTRATCNQEATNACVWYKATGETSKRCHLRYQYCGNYGAEECVETDGCMWFNDLQNGHKAGASTSSNRGRCMPDACMRLNNGQCTIQHTGGRCLWYTKAQNKAYRGKDFPGCYFSPCNNRFTKSDCRSASNKDPIYDCVWCNRYPDTLLGCHNAKMGSAAQCWNVQANVNTQLPEPENDECIGCKGSLTIDGTCQDTKTDAATCAEKCCQSPACHCFDAGDGQTGTYTADTEAGFDVGAGSDTGGADDSS